MQLECRQFAPKNSGTWISENCPSKRMCLKVRQARREYSNEPILNQSVPSSGIPLYFYCDNLGRDFVGSKGQRLVFCLKNPQTPPWFAYLLEYPTKSVHPLPLPILSETSWICVPSLFKPHFRPILCWYSRKARAPPWSQRLRANLKLATVSTLNFPF